MSDSPILVLTEDRQWVNWQQSRARDAGFRPLAENTDRLEWLNKRFALKSKVEAGRGRR
jgi:hypothetical protein